MDKNIMMSYLDRMLSKQCTVEENKRFEPIYDSFELYNMHSNSVKGILLLLDNKEIVRNVNYQALKRTYINRKLTLPSVFLVRNQKRMQYIDEGCIIDFCRHTNGIEYSLCLIAEDGEDAPEKHMLEDVILKMKLSMEIIEKYHKRNDLLIKCLDSTDEGISACNKEGRITYANKACCKILGMDQDEIINKKRFISPEYKPILARVLETKQGIIDVEHFAKVKGETVHLINSTYPVWNDQKELIGTIDIFRGIHRTRKLANTLVGQNISYKFENIIGESRILKEKIALAKSFALSDANVYIQGESGTGKELFAQSIHNYSRRKREPFIAINCANFPLDLVDSELFGYEEGAFTGAKKGGKPGKFELANGGTLFLDEIGEMQLHLQAKLLRVLETRTLFRIGGNKPINVDVKIIAATNRDLCEMVKKGEFREDLYYRLKVLFLEIPPLRERNPDVLMLADYFIKKIGMTMEKKVHDIDKEGRKLLQQYDWPGNVRELENIISRALFTCEKDSITKENLIKAGISAKKSRIIYKNELEELNKEVFMKTLKQTNGNKKKTAEILGISRPTVYRMIRKYNVKI
ncbi:sigma 54-interacting transcriptional regulator [Clostridiaceae bacterium 35-E11]